MQKIIKISSSWSTHEERIYVLILFLSETPFLGGVSANTMHPVLKNLESSKG